MNRNDKLELLRLLEERKKRKSERNPIYATTKKFKGRFIVLMGGSGSGKSYEVADIILDKVTREKNVKVIALRKEGKQISKSCFPLLISRIKKRFNIEDFDIKYSLGNESIKYNDNEIIFSGLDDVDKLKSLADCNCAWMEEADQMTFADFREMNRRLRGFDNIQILISFNPVSVLSWLKKRFFDEITDRTIALCGTRQFEHFQHYEKFDDTNIDYNKIIKIFNKDANKEVEEKYYNTLVIHSTYLDNRFVDDAYMIQMEDLKKYDEDEYNIYALGYWGVSGGTYFDKHNINKRILNPSPILKQGDFEFDYDGLSITNIRFVESYNGAVRIYEEPKKYYPYVSGGDTAGEGSDWNTATLINNVTGEDAATIRINYDEDLYARQLYCLGKYYGTLNTCYGDALIGIETNFSTHPIKELERLGYTKLYVREESPDKYTGKIVQRFGFRTERNTRPLALSMLRSVVRETPHMIKDIDTLKEMTTFIKNEKGKPEAAGGYHDDMILCRAITCYIRSQQKMSPKNLDNKGLKPLPASVKQDIRSARGENRIRLEQKYRALGFKV